MFAKWMDTVRIALGVSVIGVLSAAAISFAADAPDAARQLEARDLKALSWRSIGPANMGGRLATIALAPNNAKTYFIGFATGGVWKTTNAGTTFAPVFDKEATSSIGSIAVVDAPANWAGWRDELKGDDPASSDADLRTKKGKGKIVWVGTGEGNGRNSSSWGAGVYRSTDGGATFAALGLAQSHDIPAIAVDPRNPDVCYVAALGHLWGANKERGVYKTNDGGLTWRPVLQIDENTGAIDVLVDLADPDTVYAAMYQRRRHKWSYQSGGAGGVFKSTDAGRTWTKLTDGLPEQTGRIGLAISASHPNIIMASIESDAGGAFGGFSNRSKAGGVFRSENKGETWTRTTDFNPRPFYFSKVRIDPTNDQRVYLLGWTMYVSDDGGRTFRAGVAHVPHVDYHAMVIDPADPDHLFIGTDGGLYVSQDQGKTWDFHNQLAVGQLYNIAVDDSDPYRVGGGLQDNGSWIGSSQTIAQDSGEFMGRPGAITNAQWRAVWGGDGFHVAFDPTDANVIYAESQGGNIGRVHLDTGEAYNIMPAAKEGEETFRFNWNAPFFVSPHNPTTLYLGGDVVFKLTDRGDKWQRISHDLTTRDPDIILTAGSAAEAAGTIVSLAESPVNAGLLWAGSDDGLIHITQDDGESWKNVTPKSVGGRYIAKIEPSHHDALTAFVAVDGHRSDVVTPTILMTHDAGKSWRDIASDLPTDAPVKVVREDPNNADVLYAGTERAVYVTIDRGAHWVRLNTESLPTVAVDDLKIQSREQDLVAGTHGRSVWILDDISAISQLTPEIVQSKFHVFEPTPGEPRRYLPFEGLWGDNIFAATNPPMGVTIQYWLRESSDDGAKVSIKNAAGVEVVSLNGPSKRGINRVVWNLQPEAKQRLGNPHGMTEFAPAGVYTATVTVGDESETVDVEVLPTPEARKAGK